MGITIKHTHSGGSRSFYFGGSAAMGRLVLDVTAGNKPYCNDLTIEQAAEIRDFLNKEFPATAPRTILDDNAADFAAIPVGSHVIATMVDDPRNDSNRHLGEVVRLIKVGEKDFIFAGEKREAHRVFNISGHNLWRREYVVESKRESLARQFADLPVGPFTFVALKSDGSDRSSYKGYVKLDDSRVYTPYSTNEPSTIDQLGDMVYYRLEPGTT